MTDIRPAFPSGTILGYPRIGPRRELKQRRRGLLGRHAIDAAELEAHGRWACAARPRAIASSRSASAPDDSAIPESFSYYDQVLDAAVTAGAIPSARFAAPARGRRLGIGPRTRCFAAGARRGRSPAPLEMTKWFDTNYHYIVPGDRRRHRPSRSTRRQPARARSTRRAQARLSRPGPSWSGPVTFLLLAKEATGSPAGFRPLDRLEDLLPAYTALLQAYAAAGAAWVQLDEAGAGQRLRDRRGAGPRRGRDARLHRAERPPRRPVHARRRPLRRPRRGARLAGRHPRRGPRAGPRARRAADVGHGGLRDKVVVGGVVDGHNVWRADLAPALETLHALREFSGHVVAGTSTSLLHVPHDVADEPQLDERLRSWLAFADQKVAEVVVLGTALRDPAAAADAVAASSSARADRAAAPGVVRPEVRERLAGLSPAAYSRSDYAIRRGVQEEGARPAGAADHHDRLVPADRRRSGEPGAPCAGRGRSGGVRHS